MRRIWILFLFILFIVCVNSFDFRCNMPKERLRRLVKKDQSQAQMTQKPAFAKLKHPEVPVQKDGDRHRISFEQLKARKGEGYGRP